MNKQLLLILLPALLSATGCKQQKASETEGTTSKIEAHQPLPPKYTARYDKSVTPVRIDIERATADSVPVNLSKVASSIEYFMVGDDKYPITDVVATNEGFIAGIDPTTKRGQYLYQPPFFDKIYRYGDQITFRLSFCDTIYRIRDEQTYYPAYVTDFGKLRLTAIERIPFLAGRTNGRLSLYDPPRQRVESKSQTDGIVQTKRTESIFR